MSVVEILFSPSGGTEQVAEVICKQWSREIEKIDLCNPNEDFAKYNIDKDALVLIAVPCYNGRMPQVAKERMSKIKGNGAKCAVLCVYGNRAYEDTLVELEDVANDCGFTVIAGVAAIAEHSIYLYCGIGRPNYSDENRLKEIARDIFGKFNKNIDTKPEIKGNRPYKKLSKFSIVPNKVYKTCDKCGVCVEDCPVQAIDSVTLKSDPDKCISCMRCVYHCPKESRDVNKIKYSIISAILFKEASKPKSIELFL